MFDSSFITDKKDAFFQYENASGVISAHSVVNVVDRGDFIQGYSIHRKGYRTFRKDRVIAMFINEQDLNNAPCPSNTNAALSGDKNYNISRSVTVNTGSALDICFSGFNQADKHRLTELAKANNLVEKKGVTANLYFLCIGSNKGWRKIEKARANNTLIITEKQFIEFINTGEIPYEAPEIDSYYEEQINDEVDDLKKMLDEFSLTFRIVREPRRSTALIANFVDGYAFGWRFAVKSAFRDALDIKKTKITFEKNTYEAWTQGTSYQFNRGDVFYSDKSGYGSHGAFLELPDAVVLQIKYDCYSGYETIASFDGVLTGDFTPSRRLTSRKLDNVPILFESQSYDPGTLVIGVLKPDETKCKLKVVSELTMTQDDFIGLLQTGRYWQKKPGEPAKLVDLFANECS